MKSTAEIAEPLLRALETWRSGDRQTIIGIEGYSASGKTTLLKYLAQARSDILPVEVDDFLAPEKERDVVGTLELTLEWQAAPWFRYEVFDELLKAYLAGAERYTCQVYNRRTKEFNAEKTFDLSRPILIAEGTFLLASPLAKAMDKLVYLDVPREVADVRRWTRHLEKEPTAEREKHLAFVERYMEMYRPYLETCRPRERADLVLPA